MSLSSCQQNTILFGRAGLTTPTRLKFLCQPTFHVPFQHNGMHDLLNAKAVGTVPMVRHGAECTVFRRYYSIITKSSFTLQGNSESLRNGSGRVHGWTRLADGSIGRTKKNEQPKKPPNPNQVGPFIGTHDINYSMR